MTATITLTNNIRKTRQGTVSLAFSAEGSGISSKIFAIEVMPKSADPEAPNVRFSHVCSPAELVEFPEDEPGDSCYFRVSDIELIFDTDKLVESVIRHMEEDAGRLVREYNDLDNADVMSNSMTL